MTSEPVGRRHRTKKLVVLDYGSGNLRSAQRALERVGAEVEVTADSEDGIAHGFGLEFAAVLAPEERVVGVEFFGFGLAFYPESRITVSDDRVFLPDFYAFLPEIGTPCESWVFSQSMQKIIVKIHMRGHDKASGRHSCE